MMKSKYLRGAIATAVLVAFGGCGGGGNGGNEQQEDEQQEQVADTIAPGISSTLPASEEAGVDRFAVITAFFDEDILSSTVANTSFSLVGNGPVDGTVTFDSGTNEATFTPDQPLSILTHYTATLGTGITDLAGNALGSEYSWQFTTADGTLATAADLVHSETAGLLKPQVIYHDNGDAIAVWSQAADDIQLWASHFSAGSGWGAAVQVSTGSPLQNFDFSLAADDSGNALVAWQQLGAGVWVSHYDRDTATWGSPVNLNDKTTGGGAQVALDNSGNAIAVWSEGIGMVSDIWASYYTAGIGWGSPELIEQGAGFAYGPSLDLDDSGNAIAVWQQDDGSEMSIYANRFVSGAGWGTAAPLMDGAPESWGAAVAMDDDGNAIAIWIEDNGSRDLWSNRYDAVDGWGSAVLLENHSENVGDPQLAMNDSGTAIVAWAKYNVDTNIGSYASKRFTPSEGWGPEETFEYSGFSYYYCDLAIDNSGNALFFWEYDDGNNGTLWMNRYTADGGWATATELTSMGDDWGDSSPAVSVKSDGEGMLIFIGGSTTDQQVWTRLFQ
ncbi:Ig-like domain-containing protein [Microbulbifer sp. SA54]|uniref:Ig-like domain-containing protein n=1 Tax=Microbulbifer sp. SA54 TaxID=3401577 RepID=UPI003AB098D3